MAGDFNARTANCLDYIPNDTLSYVFSDKSLDYPTDSFCLSRRSKDEKINNFGHSLLEMCCSFDMHIMNGRLFNDHDGNFTYFSTNGQSVIDYIIASPDLFSYVSYFSVEDIDLSDHFPICCTLSMSESLQANLSNDTDPAHANDSLITWIKMKWKHELKDNFLSKFSDLFHTFSRDLESQGSPNYMETLSSFIQLYQVAGASMQTNTNMRTHNTQPEWWDGEFSSLKRDKYRALRQFRTFDSDEYRNLYITQRNRFRAVCKQKKQNFLRKKREALKAASKNPKEFWKLIKENRMTKEVETSIPARDWYNYFSDLFSNNDFPQKDLDFSDEESLRSNRNPVDSSCLNLPIADDEIINSVKSRNNNRSPGPDGINIEMYKHTLTLTLPYLNKLFNEMFDSGIFPLDWGKSIITPIHKKGSKTDPNNYRAISLIDSICKIFMNILNCRLSRWCEENTILDESQAGSRKGYSTIDNIFILTALAQKYLSKKRGRFYCIFIDFEKAFDNVQHSQLWTAFERINVNGKFLNILKSVYNNTKSCIKVNHKLIEFFNC